MDKEARNGQDDEFKNFQRLLKQVLSVPKEKLDEKREEHEQEKKEKEWAR